MIFKIFQQVCFHFIFRFSNFIDPDVPAYCNYKPCYLLNPVIVTINNIIIKNQNGFLKNILAIVFGTCIPCDIAFNFRIYLFIHSRQYFPILTALNSLDDMFFSKFQYPANLPIYLSTISLMKSNIDSIKLFLL